MTPELIAMLGGGISGFVMKFMGTLAQNQSRQFEMMLQAQGIADESADKAAARGGVWVRRFIVGIVFFGLIIAPFIFAFTDADVSIQQSSSKVFGLFKSQTWNSISGYVILPEVRQAAIAILGFYFGSSQIK